MTLTLSGARQSPAIPFGQVSSYVRIDTPTEFGVFDNVTAPLRVIANVDPADYSRPVFISLVLGSRSFRQLAGVFQDRSVSSPGTCNLRVVNYQNADST